jgi:VCBS repeat-containing protein
LKAVAASYSVGSTVNVSGANSGGGTQISDSANAVILTTSVTPVADPAIVGGNTLGGVTEDTQLAATGQLTVIDPDAGEAAFVSVENAAGLHGSFSITSGGVWLYNLNNTDPAVQALAANSTTTDSYTFATIDGTTQTVTITITGTNDAPTLTAEMAGSLADTAAYDAFASAVTGQLDGADVDNGHSLSYKIDGQTADGGGNTVLVGSYGTLDRAQLVAATTMRPTPQPSTH